jgi:hypothetical protein
MYCKISKLINSSFFEPEYFIKPLGKDEGWQVYQIAKFDDHDYPSKVYLVKNRGQSWNCNCTNFVVRKDQNDKHITMIKDWIKKGKPETPGFSYDDFIKQFRGEKAIISKDEMKKLINDITKRNKFVNKDEVKKYIIQYNEKIKKILK